MRNRTALITGITGQDGSYLAELLLEKGYIVHGILRRSSSFNTGRIDHIYQEVQDKQRSLYLHYGDLSDGSNISRVIERVQPDEIYNLGAQSHVKVSFDVPEFTAQVDAIGAIRLLDAIKDIGIPTRFYQASTSEMYGKVREVPQSETTPFYPRSPYAAAKLYAYWVTVNYREAYGLFTCNGILFNHESERRGETFVTRKITRVAGRIRYGLQEKLYLGNLEARRDWGYAPEYVLGMWLMLQQDEPGDFVLATGETRSVEEFCTLAFEAAGIPVTFEGDGVDRKGLDASGQIRIEVDPRYFRPTEVDLLVGDATKARTSLGWEPRVRFEELVRKMVENDIEKARIEASMKGMEPGCTPAGRAI